MYRCTTVSAYKYTSAFWPRVRARALCTRLFGLINTPTGRCAPPPPPIATSLLLILFIPQKQKLKYFQKRNAFLQAWTYLCSGSGMFIPDPGSGFLPIPDPGSKNSSKRVGWKKFVVIPFLVATNSQNWKLFYFWNAEEKNFGQFSKNFRFFYPKICP